MCEPYMDLILPIVLGVRRRPESFVVVPAQSSETRVTVRHTPGPRRIYERVPRIKGQPAVASCRQHGRHRSRARARATRTSARRSDRRRGPCAVRRAGCSAYRAGAARLRSRSAATGARRRRAPAVEGRWKVGGRPLKAVEGQWKAVEGHGRPWKAVEGRCKAMEGH